MIPHRHRQKGGSPLLGASRPGESGPFGRRPDDGQDNEQQLHDAAHPADQPHDRPTQRRSNTVPLSSNCDLEVSPGHYCDQPAGWLALSGDAPDMWLDRDGGNASLASFCSREHALAEPRPNLAAAKRTYATIAEMCDETPVLSAWERALTAYPEPIAHVDRNCCGRHWGDPFNAEPCGE